MTINEQKLTLKSTKRNPLRDRLRNMTKDELLAERTKAINAMKKHDTLVNWAYYSFIDYLCDTKGFTKSAPGVSVL